jgi:quinol-cytochrome oxidoreductase complex cytochrome b subunit
MLVRCVHLMPVRLFHWLVGSLVVVITVVLHLSIFEMQPVRCRLSFEMKF